MRRSRLNHLTAAMPLLIAGTVSPPAGAGETALEQALAAGATPLTADEIADRLEGYTGTWVDASGEKTVRVYYGPDNDLHGALVGGDWTGSGIYGVTEDGRVCLSWDGIDNGRLRCLDVLRVEGTITKYNSDGSLNGTYERFQEGRAF